MGWCRAVKAFLRFAAELARSGIPEFGLFSKSGSYAIISHAYMQKFDKMR